MRTPLLLLLALVAALHAFAEDFQSLAGNWSFSETATIALWRAEAKTEGEQKFVETRIQTYRKIWDRMKQPIHSDLFVTSNRMEGQAPRPMLCPSYDLIEARTEGGKLRAKVWFHEDRFDPGDMSQEWITLSQSNGVLRLERDPPTDLPPAMTKMHPELSKWLFPPLLFERPKPAAATPATAQL